MTRPSLQARPAGGTAVSRPATRALAALIVAAAGLASGPGFAATQADEDACRPDVFRLCLSAIPDEGAIVSCLDAHIQGLSPACRAVMAPSTPPPSTQQKRGAEGSRRRDVSGRLLPDR